MTSTRFDRRALLKLAVQAGLSGFALEQLAGVPLLGTWLGERLRNPLVNPYDAFAMMDDALRLGPSMLGVHQAMADEAEGWTLVQIKVLNHVYTPLVFRLGQLTGGTVTTAADVPVATQNVSNAGARSMLQSLGANDVSDKPRYQNLRFNKWFANILHNGTADGGTPTATNLLGVGTGDVAELSADKVAVQAFLHVAQIDSTVNHALRGCKLRQTLPDLTLFAQQSSLIQSPLGITCFMMGGNYDKAEGAIAANAVLSENPVESAVVRSRSVRDYVAQIGQYVGKSYADRASIEQNVIYRMDHLVQKDPVLRRDLINSIAQFKQGLTTLNSAADIESNRQTLDLGQANSQNLAGKQVGASTEFLAQCKYVAASLDLPGTPVRNFSLFVNATDLDQGPIDVATDGGGGNKLVQAFSYVEAMRQLGMGLNMLAKKIAEGKKMIVVVHSEGGRAASMADANTGFALVLGPKGPGLLDDQLYANMGLINQSTNAVLKDTGLKSSAVAWDVDGLKAADGTAANAVANTGDVQMGIVEFLEQQTGLKARGSLSAADGMFVKLKRA